MKTWKYCLICFVLLVIVGISIPMFNGTTNLLGELAYLSENHMRSIVGGCPEYCGYSAGSLEVCHCHVDLDGEFEECVGIKYYKQCALVPSTGCTDMTRYVYFTGSNYESTENQHR